MIVDKLLRKVDQRVKHGQVNRSEKYLRNAGYNKLFEQENAEAIIPQYFDLWVLVEEINRNRPAHVLEYGSGWSTYVIAETLNRLGKDWKVTSVELDEGWKNVTSGRLGEALSKNVEFISPKPEVWLYGSRQLNKGGLWYRSEKGGRRQFGVATIVFPELHSLSPDFIYLDGPSSDQVDGFRDSIHGKPFKPLVADPLYISSKYTMVVDSRRANCQFLASNFERPFIHKIHQANHFTVFNVSQK